MSRVPCPSRGASLTGEAEGGPDRTKTGERISTASHPAKIDPADQRLNVVLTGCDPGEPKDSVWLSPLAPSLRTKR